MVLPENKMENLHHKSAIELKDMAEEIYLEYASTRAMEKLYKKDAEFDEVKYKTTMMICDILHFAILQHGTKHGDVGLLKTMLPHLFSYSTEVLVQNTQWRC